MTADVPVPVKGSQDPVGLTEAIEVAWQSKAFTPDRIIRAALEKLKAGIEADLREKLGREVDEMNDLSSTDPDSWIRGHNDALDSVADLVRGIDRLRQGVSS